MIKHIFQDKKYKKKKDNIENLTIKNGILSAQ